MVATMKELLEAGVHFGHQVRRWNPKMKRYLFGERNGIYIIDLQKTMKGLEEAYNFIRETARNKQPVLFVGTKKQARDSIFNEATRAGSFYVNHRWLGGMLTNFLTIQKSIARLKKIDKMKEDGIFESLTKKEVAAYEKERAKLDKNLSGIKDMPRLPGAIFIVDPKKEALAVAEGRKLNIPIVGIVDSNCNPDEIDYVIPGNDDAIRAVALISAKMANAIMEGKEALQKAEQEAAAIAEEEKRVREEAEAAEAATAKAKADAEKAAADAAAAARSAGSSAEKTSQPAPKDTAAAKADSKQEAGQ